eukprot:939798-Pelagomonas_calceolata.AAC.7
MCCRLCAPPLLVCAAPKAAADTVCRIQFSKQCVVAFTKATRPASKVLSPWCSKTFNKLCVYVLALASEQMCCCLCTPPLIICATSKP